MWLKKLIAWQLQWNAKMLNNDLMTCSIRSNIRFLWNLLSCSFPGCIMVCLWLVGNTSLQMSFTDNSSVPVKYTPHEQYKQSPINAFIKLRHQSSTVLECMPILRLTTDKSTWQTTICLIFSKTIQTKHVQCSAVQCFDMQTDSLWQEQLVIFVELPFHYCIRWDREDRHLSQFCHAR